MSKFAIRHFEVFQPLACASIRKNVSWFAAKMPWFARELGGERDGADDRWQGDRRPGDLAIEARVANTAPRLNIDRRLLDPAEAAQPTRTLWRAI